MNNGWIKVHRQLLDNELFRNDHNALVLFLALLLLVNHRDGKYSTGRFRLADIVGMKPTTMYKTLKRLEKHKMVTCTSNSLRTIIVICNWNIYQGSGNKSSDSPVTAEGQPSDTKQERRTKNKEKNTNVQLDEPIERIYDLFIEKFKRSSSQFKLTKQRRIKIKARINDAGIEMLERAIVNTSRSSFHNGDNDRGWRADLDFIIRNYEQVEKLANLQPQPTPLAIIREPEVKRKPLPELTEEEREQRRQQIADMKKDFLTGKLRPKPRQPQSFLPQ